MLNTQKTSNCSKSELNLFRSDLLDTQILTKLKTELQNKEQYEKDHFKPNYNKLKHIYSLSQLYYKKAIYHYKSNNKELSLLYYELANYKYSSYMSMKSKFQA